MIPKEFLVNGNTGKRVKVKTNIKQNYSPNAFQISTGGH